MKRSSVECGFECRVQQSTEKVGEVRQTRNIRMFESKTKYN